MADSLQSLITPIGGGLALVALVVTAAARVARQRYQLRIEALKRASKGDIPKLVDDEVAALGIHADGQTRAQRHEYVLEVLRQREIKNQRLFVFAIVSALLLTAIAVVHLVTNNKAGATQSGAPTGSEPSDAGVMAEIGGGPPVVTDADDDPVDDDVPDATSVAVLDASQPPIVQPPDKVEEVGLMICPVLLESQARFFRDDKILVKGVSDVLLGGKLTINGTSVTLEKNQQMVVLSTDPNKAFSAALACPGGCKIGGMLRLEVRFAKHREKRRQLRPPGFSPPTIDAGPRRVVDATTTG